MSFQDIPGLRKQAAALADTPSPDLATVWNLVKKLKKVDEFGTARRLLGRVRKGLPPSAPNKSRVKLAHEEALCTYKDANLHTDKRYEKALSILDEIGLRDPNCADKEILGQGGAIYKRMWESSGVSEHLHTALAFYRAGWERDRRNDMGWCGVNAAYVLDLLTFIDETGARQSKRSPIQTDYWAEQARTLRQELQVQLPTLLGDRLPDYWFLATMAEVLFGLKDYAGARIWLERAVQANPDPWEHKTTAEQLARIARLHHVPPPDPHQSPDHWLPAWRCLKILFGDHTKAVSQCWRGKVGLALSGGGFRAALFHLGVLARLAECDVLGSVETLSTVSGGSIVGAQYYLELRHLLQSRPDDLTKDDFVALVRRLMDDTMAGVEKNLRVRTLSNLLNNVQMFFLPGYSRSMRMGQLYERLLFRKVADERRSDEPRRMRELPVQPRPRDGGPPSPSFKPRRDNWLRVNKVPNLMINTTSLNSGHNWHFTARWMGEPPGLTGEEVDMNERYRRLYYEEASVQALRNFPLAYAVAASSGVPALFEPLSLEGLYPHRTVRLVDGGVHDNQGVAALLDDGCDFILCSDASGQMVSRTDPADDMLGVLGRADSILQDRLREAQYQNLKSRTESGALQGLFFVHLKQGLNTAPVDFIGSKENVRTDALATRTAYNVDRDIQTMLSEIRTDLDSFTEVEAYALMASGYQLAAWQLRQLSQVQDNERWGGFEVNAPMAEAKDGTPIWPFAPLIPVMAEPRDSNDPCRKDLGIQLQAGKIMFGRVWCLVGWMRALRCLGISVATLSLACWVWFHWDALYPAKEFVSVGTISMVMTVVVADYVQAKYLRFVTAGRSYLLAPVLALGGLAVSWLHLLLLEPQLRARGRLSRLLDLKRRQCRWL